MARRTLALAAIVVTVVVAAALPHDDGRIADRTSALTRVDPAVAARGDPSRAGAVGGGAGRLDASDSLTAARAEILALTSEAAVETAATTGATAETVRLSGRLVAAPLEWGWVQAIPHDPVQATARLKAIERTERRWPWIVIEPDGVVSAVTHGSGDEDATLGRPGGTWAVPVGATRVDAEGAFSIELLAGRYTLLAGARRCMTRVESARLECDAEVVWPLETTPFATLELTCLAASGEPLSNGVGWIPVTTEDGATLAVTVGAGPWPGLGLEHRSSYRSDILHWPLDERGTLRLDMPAGRYCLGSSNPEHGVRISRPEHGAWGWREPIPLPLVELDLAAGEVRALTLRQAERGRTTVRVRVLDRDGAPVAGARVGLCEDDDGWAEVLLAHAPWAATTGADGVGTFLEVSPGMLFPIAAQGARAGRRPAVLVRTEPLALEVNLDEDELGVVLLRVVDAETNAPSTRVMAALEGDPYSVLDLAEPGVWRLARTPLGSGRIRVLATGRAATVIDVDVEPEPRVVEARLAPSAIIRGRLEGPPDVEWEDVSIETLRGDQIEDVTPGNADARGFELATDLVPHEEVQVRVRAMGHVTQVVRVRPPITDLVITLADAPVQELRVVQADGEPADDEFVYVFGAGEDGSLGARARLDENGYARIVGRLPSPALIRAESQRECVPFESGMTLRLPAAPEPGPRREYTEVRGRVVDATGAAVGFAELWYRTPGDTFSGQVNGDGALRLLTRPERITVRLERVDLGRVVVPIDVPPGGLTDLVVRIPACAPIRVRAPAAARFVTARPAAAPDDAFAGRDAVHRRPDGTFDLGRLAPGRWRFVAYASRDDYDARRGRGPVGAIEVELVAPDPIIVTIE